MKNKELEELNKSVYKTNDNGNELTVYDCLNRHERRKMMKMKKKNKRR